MTTEDQETMVSRKYTIGDSASAVIVRDLYNAIRDWGTPEGCTSGQLFDLFDGVYSKNKLSYTLSNLMLATNSPLSGIKTSQARSASWFNVRAVKPLPDVLELVHKKNNNQRFGVSTKNILPWIDTCDNAAFLLRIQRAAAARRRQLDGQTGNQAE